MQMQNENCLMRIPSSTTRYQFHCILFVAIAHYCHHIYQTDIALLSQNNYNNRETQNRQEKLDVQMKYILTLKI